MNKFKFMATAAAVSVLITGGSVSVHEIGRAHV